MNSKNYITMRKIAFALLMFLTLSLKAQDNVMKFMGIPIDGSKSEMIDKLQRKGFAPEQVEVDLENAQNEVVRLGGEIPEGKVRERDGNYFMHGYFDGKSCKLIIVSYNNIVYQIMVAFESSYKELDAKVQFNTYVDQLGKKYTNPTKYDFSIDLDSDLSMPFENNIHAFFTAVYDEFDKPHGMVSMEMSHPRYKEYYILLRYYNIDNWPNGEDL